MKIYDYNCLMIQFKIPNWIDLISSIVNYEDLEGEGYSTEPHCTLLYGIHDYVTIDDLKPYLYPLSCYTVSINNISFFRNDKYDVVKLDVNGNTLHQTNKKLCANLPYSSDYPDYHPHATIAYTQPGTGEKYVRQLSKPYILKPYSFKYSYTSGRSDYFTID